MNTKVATFREVLVVGAVLWGGGGLLSGTERSGTAEPPQGRLETIESTVYGHGFRELWADFLWIGVYRDWRARDVGALRRSLGWVGAVNPQSLTFWLQGARMLGLDAAAWRRADTRSLAEVNRINREQLAMANDRLDQAEVYFPGRAAIGIERAILILQLTGDLSDAEQALAMAHSCVDAPYFVARIRAEFLTKLGRPEDALRLLETELAHLPANEPSAMVAVVRSRIDNLRIKFESEKREMRPSIGWFIL